MKKSHGVLLDFVARYPRPTALLKPTGEVILNQAAESLLGASGLLLEEPAACGCEPICRWLQDAHSCLPNGEGGRTSMREFPSLLGPQLLSAEMARAQVGTNGTTCVLATLENVTEQRLAELGVGLATRLLNRLNRFRPGRETYRFILRELQEFTGFEAVALRLLDGEDYPYYVTYGFDDSFVVAEKYLCTRDESGQILFGEDGAPALECMCGIIIKGRTDAGFSFFTKGGSFWRVFTTT